MCLKKFKSCLRAALARSRILSMPGIHDQHNSALELADQPPPLADHAESIPATMTVSVGAN